MPCPCGSTGFTAFFPLRSQMRQKRPVLVFTVVYIASTQVTAALYLTVRNAPRQPTTSAHLPSSIVTHCTTARKCNTATACSIHFPLTQIISLWFFLTFSRLPFGLQLSVFQQTITPEVWLQSFTPPCTCKVTSVTNVLHPLCLS